MSSTPKYREVGGGPSTGLANDFVSFLQQGLTSGQFGVGSGGARFGEANPYGSTEGIAGVLNSLLSGEAAGPMNEMISKQADRDAMALRERYGMGGTGYGTGAAYGEATLRSETAPKMAQVMQQGQMSALQQLLPIFTSLSGKGITQREGYMQPPAWQSMAAIAAPIIGGGLGMLAGGPGGAAMGAQAGGSLFGSGQPNVRNSAGAQQFWNPGMTPNFQMPQLSF